MIAKELDLIHSNTGLGDLKKGEKEADDSLLFLSARGGGREERGGVEDNFKGAPLPLL